MTTSRTAVRKRLRAHRRDLDPQARRAAADGLLKIAAASAAFRRGRHIAFYLPNDGEQDIFPLLERAYSRRKSCYLPVLDPLQPRLRFARYEPGDPLAPNRFGIPEPCGPAARDHVDASALDLVLLPLVAFDPDGNRLGMGGGFYDRTLAFLRLRRHWRRPLCYGVAFELQHIDHIAPAPWDVPLDGCLTERREYRFGGAARR